MRQYDDETLGAYLDGELDRATAAGHFAQSLPVHLAIGNRWGIALALEGVADLAIDELPEEALRLAAAAAALRLAIGRPLPPVEQPLVAASLAAARQSMSAEAAERSWREGTALSEVDSVAAALAVVGSPLAD